MQVYIVYYILYIHITHYFFPWYSKLGDWTFLASGTGLSPSPSKPLYIHGMLSENSSLIVPFRNPTEHTVIVEVNVKENVLNTGMQNTSLLATVHVLRAHHFSKKLAGYWRAPLIYGYLRFKCITVDCMTIVLFRFRVTEQNRRGVSKWASFLSSFKTKRRYFT